ncbi:MAG: ribbon-helix-helix protein, CopG family [Candidatus Omnitrophica bacterium]|nr:ribbon-helix-helix protein, CopG family [Candidatus Omnitrophota bacterium]
MYSKQKVTVTIDEGIVREIDRLSKEMNETRSHLVEEALKAWRRGQVEQALIDGYRAMAKEDAEIAEQNLAAGKEAIIK